MRQKSRGGSKNCSCWSKESTLVTKLDGVSRELELKNQRQNRDRRKGSHRSQTCSKEKLPFTLVGCPNLQRHSSRLFRSKQQRSTNQDRASSYCLVGDQIKRRNWRSQGREYEQLQLGSSLPVPVKLSFPGPGADYAIWWTGCTLEDVCPSLSVCGQPDTQRRWERDALGILGC